MLSPSLALLASIAGILLLLRLKIHPGFAILVGSLVVSLLVLPLQSIPPLMIQSLISYQTIRLLVIVASAVTLSYLMEEKGLLAKLAVAMEMIEREGLGVVLYMRQEGRGIGLASKILAYELQDNGRDTVEANLELGFAADLRDYGIGAQILSDLGISTIRLITNNPKKLVGLEGHRLTVTDRVPLEVPPNRHNARYLETKRDKLGHLMDLPKISRDKRNV